MLLLCNPSAISDPLHNRELSYVVAVLNLEASCVIVTIPEEPEKKGV